MALFALGQACVAAAGKLLGPRRPLLDPRGNHVQQGQGASSHWSGCTQQVPAFVRFQVRPANQDDRLLPTQQPARHLLVNGMVLKVQMPVAEQPVEGLERCSHTQGTSPGPGTSVKVKRPPWIRPSTACSSTSRCRACIRDSELDRHFCNTWSAHMPSVTFGFSHLEGCVTRAHSSSRHAASV